LVVVKVAADVVGVVDDDEGIRVGLDGLLRSAGFQVVAFPSAEALLESAWLPRVACLILDLHLPDMDGLSLQRRLVREDRQIPVIVLTAHGDGEARAQAMDKGAVAFLTKPFDSGLLLAEVTRALTRRQGE